MEVPETQEKKMPLSPMPEVMLDGDHDYTSITNKIASVPLSKRPPRQWWISLGVAFICLNLLLVSVGWLLLKGVGIWGINSPVGWAFDITNFVWWIGIGHAGTLISAILLLMKQRWRTSINRLAETMTLFAVCCAGLFPLLHLGRPWIAYWLFPTPNSLGLWPNFRSPLVWDVFAVSTYLTVSFVFWFVGLIPDLATMRDKAASKVTKAITGIMAMGWRNSAAHWHRYEAIYVLLAGISTPLVVSVHSIVSLDFAVSIIPGWHTTIFPPYFVAGAVYSGFAMVLSLVLPLRKWYGLKDMITDNHLEWMAKIMLTTGLIVFYGYSMEAYYAWYSGNIYEWFMMKNRALGPYAFFYWSLIFCNGLVPQLLWSKKLRTNWTLLFWITILVNIGMWLERFIIIVTSLHRDYVSSSWGMFSPTIWDIMLFVGTFGVFFGGMVFFVKCLPMIPIAEMKHLLHLQKHDKEQKESH